jgi:hypothetical protein
MVWPTGGSASAVASIVAARASSMNVACLLTLASEPRDAPLDDAGDASHFRVFGV